MPDTGRRTGALALIVLSAILVTVLGPSVTAASEPPGIDRFMSAVGRVESGGRYTARNPITGAYGKYQILPSNWRAWAREYLGAADSAPTPRNQERVARAKFRSLHHWLDSWRPVAYWWLTGRAERNPARWSSYGRRYVDRIMSLYGSHPAATEAAASQKIQESSGAIAYAGIWARASHSDYSGGEVRYATEAGASATLTFTGTKVTWVGPVGPTRGSARVLVDGVTVKTVDLHTSQFEARVTLFAATFPSAGAHTLTVEVLGTKGHALVAIDAFTVRP